MRSNLWAGVLSGLAAGLAFGLLMQKLPVVLPDGREASMLAMVGSIVGNAAAPAGWTYHLFNSAVIGGIFGVLLGRWDLADASSALTVGVIYGVAWWILGGLILMPLFMGLPPFSPLEGPLAVAAGSLVGHLIFGLVLGGSFLGLKKWRRPSHWDRSYVGAHSPDAF